jgi:hypothetical protein
MTTDKLKMKVTVKAKVLKYGPGKDPERDSPDEIIEFGEEFPEDEAKKFMEEARRKGINIQTIE